MSLSPLLHVYNRPTDRPTHTNAQSCKRKLKKGKKRKEKKYDRENNWGTQPKNLDAVMAAPCTGIGWKPRASPANRPTDRPCSLPPLLKETDRTASRDPPLYTYTTSIIHIFYLFTTVYLSFYTYIHTCLLLLLLLFEGKNVPLLFSLSFQLW